MLEKYRTGNGYHIGDLDAFEQEVVDAHEPIGETFLFLCRDCHRDYDSQPGAADDELTGAVKMPGSNASHPNRGDADQSRAFIPSGETHRSLEDEFYSYLIDSGYTERTKSGNPGTAYSYKNAVDRVCAWEGCSWEELAGQIDKAVVEYSPGGIKAQYGRQSHNTIINGLRAFGRFCATRPYHREGPASEPAYESPVRPFSRGSSRYDGDDLLPIFLIPENQDEFKSAFLASGRAEIREYYADGSQKSKTWKRRMSSGFSKTSNIIGNLRSRGEYRSGTWQESGLVRIEVEVKV